MLYYSQGKRGGANSERRKADEHSRNNFFTYAYHCGCFSGYPDKEYDKDGKAVAEKSVRTAGKPHHIELVSNRNELTADGKDLASG